MAERSQEEQPKKIPRGLAALIGCDIQTDLEQFRDGEVDRAEVIRRVRERVEIAMNAVAAREGYHPKIDKLPRKE